MDFPLSFVQVLALSVAGKRINVRVVTIIFDVMNLGSLEWVLGWHWLYLELKMDDPSIISNAEFEIVVGSAI